MQNLIQKNRFIIPLPKKLLTIFTLSPKLTNGENGENSENGENGENVRFVLFFWYYNQDKFHLKVNCGFKKTPFYNVLYNCFYDIVIFIYSY